MAAIMVAIEQLIEEEAQATPPRSSLGLTLWKHWGLEEMMSMRQQRQLRIRRGLIPAFPPRRRGLA